MSDPDDEEDYQPRANDHLVEPMFAGLGARRDEESEAAQEESEEAAGEERPATPGFLARLLGLFRRQP